MKLFKFNSALPFQHNFSGKFSAPSAEWMHMTRQLFDFELFVVTSGCLYIADHEKEYTVSRGEYLLMAPTARQHGFKSGSCEFYWLHFQPLTAYDVTSDPASAEPDATAIAIPEFGQLRSLDRMLLLMKQLQDSDRRYGMRSLNNFNTSVILSELSAQSFIARKYSKAESDTQLFHDIADYIRLNVCAQLKVADIADYFGYNEKYLTTYFRRRAKVSLKQYILQTKMEHAKAQLSETNHSVAQIGYNIGYSDPHNFSNAFKRITGLTPSEYRESYSRRQLYKE